MGTRFDTILAEFRAPRDDRGSGVGDLSEFLLKQQREFVVEERVFEQEEVTNDPEWTEWLENNRPDWTGGYYLATFKVSKADIHYFRPLFEEFIRLRREG